MGAGERGDLAVLIAGALEYDIDFHRDTRQGDSYSVVVDKLYDDQGEWKDYGELHAVRYVNAGRSIFAFRFELPTGESGYYDFEGNSIQRTFLMSRWRIPASPASSPAGGSTRCTACIARTTGWTMSLREALR